MPSFGSAMNSTEDSEFYCVQCEAPGTVKLLGVVVGVGMLPRMMHSWVCPWCGYQREKSQ